MIASLKQQPVSPASRSAQWLERLGKCRGLDQCVFGGGGGGGGFKSPWTHDGKRHSLHDITEKFNQLCRL